MNPLSTYGWTKELEELWRDINIPGTLPARVIADFGTSLKVAMPAIITAELSGKLAHYTGREHIPKVGDWVLVRISSNNNAVIELVLPRQTEIARKVAGKQTTKQVLAANVDVAFVLLALDNDFSVDRVSRFLYQLSVNAIRPVIVLNKADKVENLTTYISQLESFKLPIIATIATEGTGVTELRSFIPPGKTAVLLGSSGVGKSTLTNQLLGQEVQRTQTIRTSDETGKHTTVHRELFILPEGGLLIDMPGIRELQLWGSEETLNENFDDIITLAHHCKYSSCRHGNEQGCAIQKALNDGRLEQAHYASFLKMKSELSGLQLRTVARIKQDSAKSKRTASRRQDTDALKEQRTEINERY